MTTSVVTSARRNSIVRDESTGRVWLDTLLELDDGTFQLASTAREFRHRFTTVACWLTTVMFGMLVWITEVVAQ